MAVSGSTVRFMPRRRRLISLAMLLAAGCSPATTPAPTAAPSKPAESKPAATTAPPKPADAKPAETKPTAVAAKPAEAKPSGPLRKVKMTQAAISLSFTQIYVARHKGFFAEQGLELEQISTGGGGPDLQALISGDVEFNSGGGTYQADALKQGQKIISVFNYIDKNIVNVAMHVDVAREKGITEQSPIKDRLAALKGTKFGATRPGALTFQQAEYHVRMAGLTPQVDVQIVGAGEGPALIAALETRQVDVILQSIPVPEQAVARGHAMMLINNTKGDDPSLSPFIGQNLYVRPDFADKEPDVVQKFVNAMKTAGEWMAKASPEEIVATIRSEFPQMDEAVLIGGVASIKAATNPTGILDKKAVENTLKMQGQTTGVDEVYALFTDRFVKGGR